ncbi:MAG: GtrA-like protein [Clostridiales bacterium]|nr:GtrA-like protein [Clostridiales bacterium]
MGSNVLINKLRENKYLSNFLTDTALAQLKRYLITGFSTAGIEIGLLWIFKSLVHLDDIVANSIALTISFWFNFLVNRIWSFKSKDNLKRQLIIYCCLFLFNLGASDLIMYVLIRMLGLHFLIAKVFAIGAVVSWNFVLYKKVIFK